VIDGKRPVRALHGVKGAAGGGKHTERDYMTLSKM
jgi:hypothetical protein